MLASELLALIEFNFVALESDSEFAMPKSVLVALKFVTELVALKFAFVVSVIASAQPL